MDQKPVSSASQALRQGAPLLALTFGLSLVVNLLRLTGPLFIILIYDRVLPARSEETLIALFLMVCLFLLAQSVIDYARRRLLARFGAQFQERLELSLLGRAPPRAMFEEGSSKPHAGLDEVDGLRAFFHSSSLIAVLDVVWTPMFLFVVFVLNPMMGWVCLGGMALILALVLVRQTFLGRRARDSVEASQGIADLRGLIITSRRTIQTQGMGAAVRNRWLRARQTKRDRAIALRDWTVWFDTFSGAVVQFTRFGVLAAGAWLIIEGELSVGAMVAAAFLVTRVLAPVENFLSEIPDILAARRSWGRLNKSLAATEEPDGEGVADVAPNPRARLAISGVSLRNPRSGEALLKSVSLSLAPGQMIQITGMTGRGKTLFAESILGLVPWTGGSILFNGHPLARLGEGAISQLIGYVPEQPQFAAGTLAENIAHLEPEPDAARVVNAARKACLHAIISALPDGYQTRIDALASTLSRGQRSQLALARALYHAPQLLIIDDLDPMMTELVPKTLDKTFDQLLQAGGSVLVFSRKPLEWRQISETYQIDQARLRPLRTGANAANATARIAVVPDAATQVTAAKAAKPKSPPKLVG